MYVSGKGDLFGPDISPLVDDKNNKMRSDCDVKSLTYCDLQCIFLRGLMDVMEIYPDFAEKFAEDIQHDLTYNLREGYEEEEVNMTNSGVEVLGAGVSSNNLVSVT